MAVTSIDKNESMSIFPLLMSSRINGCVVLFSGKNGDSGIGTLVKEGKHSPIFPLYKHEPIGHYSCDWVFSNFEPYVGEIIISNNK